MAARLASRSTSSSGCSSAILTNQRALMFTSKPIRHLLVLCWVSWYGGRDGVLSINQALIHHEGVAKWNCALCPSGRDFLTPETVLIPLRCLCLII